MARTFHVHVQDIYQCCEIYLNSRYKRRMKLSNYLGKENFTAYG